MKPYFILTGIPHGETDRELLFGDYDRDVVADERMVIRDSQEGLDPADPDHALLIVKSLRVHRVPGDRQIDIDAFMRAINAGGKA